MGGLTTSRDGRLCLIGLFSCLLLLLLLLLLHILMMLVTIMMSGWSCCWCIETTACIGKEKKISSAGFPFWISHTRRSGLTSIPHLREHGRTASRAFFNPASCMEARPVLTDPQRLLLPSCFTLVTLWPVLLLLLYIASCRVLSILMDFSTCTKGKEIGRAVRSSA